MTPLTKTVARKSTSAGPNRRAFVVMLASGDLIGFRDERRRKVYWRTLRGCYEDAIKAEVARERQLKKAAKKAKR